MCDVPRCCCGFILSHPSRPSTWQLLSSKETADFYKNCRKMKYLQILGKFCENEVNDFFSLWFKQLTISPVVLGLWKNDFLLYKSSIIKTPPWIVQLIKSISSLSWEPIDRSLPDSWINQEVHSTNRRGTVHDRKWWSSPGLNGLSSGNPPRFCFIFCFFSSFPSFLLFYYTSFVPK
jgi:hypothetical protein